MTPRPVRLHLGAHAPTAGVDVSGVAVAGDTLFLAPDEGASLLRLRRDGPGWGSAEEVPLGEAVDLPGKPGDEGDAEGLDLVDGCLWVVGSHSAKRRRVKPGTPADEVAARLARVSPEKSRRLLARLPCARAPTGRAPPPAPERGSRLGGGACSERS